MMFYKGEFMSNLNKEELAAMLKETVVKPVERENIVDKLLDAIDGDPNVAVWNMGEVGRPTDRRGKIIKGDGIKAAPVFGYTIEMYGDDHLPTHVHVKNGTADLGKIILYPNVYVENPKTTRIPKNDHAKLIEHFKINKKYYQQQWNALLGKPQSDVRG
jgi:hypothetical protein